MPSKLCAAGIVIALTVPVNAADTPDPRYAAVSALGELNGIALQCKYLDQVRRMKAAVVANVPKERSFGLAFDQATNDAFLAFIRQGDACPTHDAHERQVGHAIDRMRTVFTEQ
jgi:hypothetical protein